MGFAQLVVKDIMNDCMILQMKQMSLTWKMKSFNVGKTFNKMDWHGSIIWYRISHCTQKHIIFEDYPLDQNGVSGRGCHFSLSATESSLNNSASYNFNRYYYYEHDKPFIRLLISVLNHQMRSHLQLYWSVPKLSQNPLNVQSTAAARKTTELVIGLTKSLKAACAESYIIPWMLSLSLLLSLSSVCSGMLSFTWENGKIRIFCHWNLD